MCWLSVGDMDGVFSVLGGDALLQVSAFMIPVFMIGADHPLLFRPTMSKSPIGCKMYSCTE